MEQSRAEPARANQPRYDTNSQSRVEPAEQQPRYDGASSQSRRDLNQSRAEPAQDSRAADMERSRTEPANQSRADLSQSRTAPPPQQSSTLSRTTSAARSGVLLPPRRTAAEAHPRHSFDYPFADQHVAELQLEATGINYSHYEELKELEPTRRQQFDAELHALVADAVSGVATPQDVWIAVRPGVIGAVLLQYSRGSRPTLLDAEWSLRVFVAVRTSPRLEPEVSRVFVRQTRGKQTAFERLWNAYFHTDAQVQIETSSQQRDWPAAAEQHGRITAAPTGADDAKGAPAEATIPSALKQVVRRRSTRRGEHDGDSADDLQTVDEYVDRNGDVVRVRERVSPRRRSSSRGRVIRKKYSDDSDSADERRRRNRSRSYRSSERSRSGRYGGNDNEHDRLYDREYDSASSDDRRYRRERHERRRDSVGLIRSDRSDDDSGVDRRYRAAGSVRRSTSRPYDDSDRYTNSTRLSIHDRDDRGSSRRRDADDDYTVRVRELRQQRY
jgi:hypothetical protein